MVDKNKPHLVLVCGPNGAGKSTFTKDAAIANAYPVVDADKIAKDMNLGPMDAGKEAFRQIKSHLDKQKSFVRESTLTAKFDFKLMEDAKQNGYKVSMIYIGLASIDDSKERVRARYSLGGHDVPAEDIARRYDRSIENLFKATKIADEVNVYDNSGKSKQKVAIFENGQLAKQYSAPAWFKTGYEKSQTLKQDDKTVHAQDRKQAVQYEDILLRTFKDAHLLEVQQKIVEAAKTEPENYLKKYQEHPESHGGRYVCADLMKEMFDVYNNSKEARNKYNAVVHNSAAVLASAQYKIMLEHNSVPGRDKVIFLTGIPGAGKTSTILAGGAMPDEWRGVFEGQLANVESAIPKIQSALDKGLKPVIFAVHATPADALKNTFKRFNHHGRGASIGIMAHIQGNLPKGLKKIHEHFGDKVELKIFDFRDRQNPKQLTGWKNLSILESEGNHDTIKERLAAAVREHFKSGNITENCFRQAVGQPALVTDRWPDGRPVGQSSFAKHQENDRGSGVSEKDREKNLLKKSGCQTKKLKLK